MNGSSKSGRSWAQLNGNLHKSGRSKDKLNDNSTKRGRSRRYIILFILNRYYFSEFRGPSTFIPKDHSVLGRTVFALWIAHFGISGPSTLDLTRKNLGGLLLEELKLNLFQKSWQYKTKTPIFQSLIPKEKLTRNKVTKWWMTMTRVSLRLSSTYNET